MHTFFDGLTYNLRGYFANDAIFEKGSNKHAKRSRLLCLACLYRIMGAWHTREASNLFETQPEATIASRMLPEPYVTRYKYCSKQEEPFLSCAQTFVSLHNVATTTY